jgi:hypothetical protein
MKLTKSDINLIEKNANARLASMHPEQRPPVAELPGQRIQSVAYGAKESFECTTTNGHVVWRTAEQVAAL